MKEQNENSYHKELRNLMDQYVHFVYKVTKNFPRDELYGVISQIRRAALSVILNYIEGYARCGDKSNKNFVKISYGSLKESKYLLHFSLVEEYLSKEDYETGQKMADRIGAMLWGMLKNEK